MSSMQFHPSPFVSMRESASATAFYDLVTGRQLVLSGPVGAALASVFRENASFDSFMLRFPVEAGQAVSLSLFTSEPPPGPYPRSMLSSIDIEPAGSCNAVCGMCPRASMTRPKTLMTAATFDAMCRQLSDDFPQVVRQIYFCGFGEPLQNPMLADMSRRIRPCARECRIAVISNAGLLTDQTIASIVNSEIDVFSCSFKSNSLGKKEP